ncbi:MAG: type II secretion system F family protein [Candidatus Nanoarchaeia archaeon]|nr:type II secretion system F family protein [Candidatus Nanoarchaeia archaeon]
MIKPKEDIFSDLKKALSNEKKIAEEMVSLLHQTSHAGSEENATILSQIASLKQKLSEESKKIPEMLDKFSLTRKLRETDKRHLEPKKPKKGFFKKIMEEVQLAKKFKISRMERNVVKRLEKKKAETAKEKGKKPSGYAGFSSKLFSEFARPLVSGKNFDKMIKDLLKTNLGIVPSAYISIIFLSVLISIGISVVLFLFLLFFNISTTAPFITPVANILQRFLVIFWVLFAIPIVTFIFLYVYPSIEKKSLETGIDQELPFATINMSAIAGSRIEPTNIFHIIVATGEYPHLKSQFTKVMNEITIYGHDLVTALRNSADSCPSKKLADLYNSLATNITSGGNLGEFFEKRSDSLLLDYRLERERYTRASETFIDVYISIVIAAPMILMLLLMMIQVSGLGLALTPTTLSLIMILGVAGVNFVFLMFLRLKQPSQ